MHGLTNPKLTALSNALNCVFILSCDSYSRTSLAPCVSGTDHPVGIQQLQNITADWTGWPWPSSQTDVFSSIPFWTSKKSLKFCVTQLHSIIKAGSLLNTHRTFPQVAITLTNSMKPWKVVLTSLLWRTQYGSTWTYDRLCCRRIRFPATKKLAPGKYLGMQ